MNIYYKFMNFKFYIEFMRQLHSININLKKTFLNIKKNSQN